MLQSKQSFLSQVQHRCADRLTVADMDSLMRILSDLLQNFRMEEIRISEIEQDDLLGSFIASMKVQGRSPKTIDRYRLIIGKFMEYAQTPTRQINVYHIRNWIAAEKARGIQDSTLEGTRQVLSSYFGWLYREGLIEKSPMANVGVIKCRKKQKKTYSEVEIEKLNRCCHSLRDRAILHFLASTGCRISEMTELDRDAVDTEALECVVHGKGDKERTVYMDEVTGMLLEEYLSSRKDDCPALFMGRLGERLQPNGVRVMLKVLGREAGVDHVHPHKFRRTLATNMARHGMPIQEVANILGHEKLDTTMRYVNLNKEDTKADYRRFAS